MRVGPRPRRLRALAQQRLWERRGRSFYRRWIRPGDLCFDVGANVGERSRLFLALGAHVVAVEPQPDCVAALRSIGSGGLTIEEVALGAELGRATLRRANSSTISSLADGWIDRVQESGRFVGAEWTDEIDVPLTTLDELIARYGTPAFCKIDVEGYEAEVLAGLSQPLRCLSFEFTPEWPEAAERALARLELLGFSSFNFSVGESLTLEWREWRDAEAMGAFFEAVPQDALFFGDVYATAE